MPDRSVVPTTKVSDRYPPGKMNLIPGLSLWCTPAALRPVLWLLLCSLRLFPFARLTLQSCSALLCRAARYVLHIFLSDYVSTPIEWTRFADSDFFDGFAEKRIFTARNTHTECRCR